MKMNLKKFTALMLAFVLCLGLFAGCGGSDDAAEQQGETQEEQEIPPEMMPGELKEFSQDELLTGLHHIEMKIKDKGVIKLELDADQAPITVTNFVSLVKEGFFDGLTFHRVLPGSLIQGGSPTHDGLSGGVPVIKGEFAANGVENGISHVRGTISLARAADYDSGSCQFFIMSQDQTGYDGQYAGFGRVTEGMEIVDDICNNTQIADNNGTVPMEIQPVMEKVTFID